MAKACFVLPCSQQKEDARPCQSSTASRQEGVLLKLEIEGRGEVNNAAFVHFHWFLGPLIDARRFFDLPQGGHTPDHPPESHRFGVHPRQRRHGHEELRAVGMRPLGRHCQDTGSIELHRKRFVFKGVAEYRLPAVPFAVYDVAPLNPPARNDAMEDGAFVLELRSPSAEAHEVLASCGTNGLVKLKENPLPFLFSNLQIHVSKKVST
mmetsp:Transcript_76398/g.153390  ORF Transcript_76398/g.153390 Transcript_76398/m.153390 type:complete len:208 (+) Transcript_76398:134-757(+)